MNRIQYETRTFTDNEIVSGEAYLARSLLASALEISTLDIEVYSTDHTLSNFVVDTPVAYYVDNSRIGTFYLEDIERVARTRYAIHAISAAGVLDKRTHYGGIYTGEAVRDVVQDICGDLPVFIASNVAGIKLYGWLPVASARSNLAQVLFATSATLTNDSTGALWVQGLDQAQTRAVSADETEEDATVEYGSPAVDVVVIEHQYVESQEETTLFEGTTSTGDIITFSEPIHTLSATGFSITESGANYAIVTAGSGKLTGKKYTHATREVRGQRSGTRAASTSPNGKRVENATLVSLANARAVADRLADYYAQAERIVADVVYKADDAGDVLSQYHPYDDVMVQTCIESLDITMSRTLMAHMTSLVGYIPPDISQIEYYDTFEVLTGTGTWTAPEGARNCRAVLIGAGFGGQSATAGKAGSRGSKTGASGGEGGLGGKAGSAGKVFQTEVDLTVQNSFPYSCGVHGVGGTYNTGLQNDGTAGTETTFGVITSASGTVSPVGYTNPFDKSVYAIPGKDGLNGGKGGDSKFQQGGKSDDGESVGEFTGGVGGRSYYNGPDQTGYDQQNSAGGGSGAAYGSNGQNAQDARSHLGTPGANGVDAMQYSAAIPLGGGGHGGNGGSGGGGGGCLYYLPYDGEREEVYRQDGGSYGNGTAGNDGGDGCIILFYSIPKEVGA